MDIETILRNRDAGIWGSKAIDRNVIAADSQSIIQAAGIGIGKRHRAADRKRDVSIIRRTRI